MELGGLGGACGPRRASVQPTEAAAPLVAPAHWLGEARNIDLDVKSLAFLGSGKEFKVSKSPLHRAQAHIGGLPDGGRRGRAPAPLCPFWPGTGRG